MRFSALTPTFADIKTWVRAAALTVNQLISGKQDKSDNLTSIAELDLTGNSGEVIAVKATEDGFELVAVSGGSGIADGDYGDVTVSGSGTVLSIDAGVVSTTELGGDITTAGKALLDDTTAGDQLTTLGLSANGKSLVTAADYAAMKALLDLEIGTDVQAYNATLAALAGLSLSQGDILYRDGSGLTKLSAGSAGQFLKTNGAGANPAWASASGSLIGRQQFTSGSGTYTPTAGTNSVIIEMVGGGGGGAGSANPTGSNSGRAGSGGGGAYLRKRLTANFSGAGYSVGAAGTGGAAGANNGNDGGDTTFTDTAGSPTVYTAGKGRGGVSSSAVSDSRFVTPAAGGVATNGDLNIPGGPSQAGGIMTANLHSYSGNGGSSMFSGGALTATSGSANNSNPGNNAAGYGGGGSGAACNGTGGAAAGGNGSAGIIIIWEYS